jgi:hypothetical protein
VGSCRPALVGKEHLLRILARIAMGPGEHEKIGNPILFYYTQVVRGYEDTTFMQSIPFIRAVHETPFIRAMHGFRLEIGRVAPNVRGQLANFIWNTRLPWSFVNHRQERENIKLMLMAAIADNLNRGHPYVDDGNTMSTYVLGPAINAMFECLTSLRPSRVPLQAIRISPTVAKLT